MRVRLIILVAVLFLSAMSSAGPSPMLKKKPHAHAHSVAERVAFMQRAAARAPDAWKALPKVPAAVDGSQNPGLIPDVIAYRHFIKATARSATTEDRERREFFLTRAGLDFTDRLAYANALGDVDAQLNNVARQRQAGGRTLSPDVLRSLKGVEDQVLAGAQQRIQTALSSAGAATLQSHINDYIKRRVTLYEWSMK